VKKDGGIEGLQELWFGSHEQQYFACDDTAQERKRIQIHINGRAWNFKRPQNIRRSINVPKNSQQQKNDPKHKRRPES
jgi:hypothetical protein